MKLIDIIRYPLKSGAAQHLLNTQVSLIGIEGDRRFMLAEPSGKFITARKDPQLLGIDLQVEGGSVSIFCDGKLLGTFSTTSSDRLEVNVWSRTLSVMQLTEASKLVSELVGREARLVFNDADAEDIAEKRYPWGPILSDGYPLLLTNNASLEALDAASGGVFEMARFRPNLVIDGDTPWQEDSWSAFRIGSVLFERKKPCERCVLTTRDPLTGEKSINQEPLKTLAKIHRGEDGAINFGQNIAVVEPGTISIGDRVELLN